MPSQAKDLTLSSDGPAPMGESAKAPVVLGLDFGGTKIAAAVCDLDGQRLASATVDTNADDGARACLERGVVMAQQLLGSAVPDRALAAVGACTFGIPGESGIALAPAVPGWEELRLRQELRQAFGDVEISLANDVKAAAQAEATWGALVGCDPGIYLNLGTGLGVAIVIQGSVLLGAHGASGEIGYNLRTLHDIGLPLERRRPLEDIVSGMGLGRAAAAVSTVDTAAEVFGAAEGDPRMARLLASFLDELSYHLVNLTIAIDPARIVVGGGMVRSWDQLRDGLQKALGAAVPYPPELVVAHFPYDAPLMGAVALGTAAAEKARAVLSRHR
jgi:glucokinase